MLVDEVDHPLVDSDQATSMCVLVVRDWGVEHSAQHKRETTRESSNI